MDVVVVSYNTEGELRQLAVDPIFRVAFDRVIVVDNASKDGSREVATGAGFELIAMDRNVGFAAGANHGVRHATSRHVVVMNPDVRFTNAEDLIRLSAHLENPSVALVGPALILPDGGIQDSARRVPSPVDLIVRRFLHHQPDVVREIEPVDVEWVVGACVALDRDIFEALGRFHERFFLYFEDVDFSVRARRVGYRVRYDPTIRVKHVHHAASRGRLTSSAARHHIASAVRFYVRHPGCLWPRGGPVPVWAPRGFDGIGAGVASPNGSNGKLAGREAPTGPETLAGPLRDDGDRPTAPH